MFRLVNTVGRRMILKPVFAKEGERWVTKI